MTAVRPRSSRLLIAAPAASNCKTVVVSPRSAAAISCTFIACTSSADRVGAGATSAWVIGVVGRKTGVGSVIGRQATTKRPSASSPKDQRLQVCILIVSFQPKPLAYQFTQHATRTRPHARLYPGKLLQPLPPPRPADLGDVDAALGIDTEAMRRLQSVHSSR